MLPFWKKYWRTLFDLALIGVTIYLFMLLFSYLYKIATPIFLAFIIFAMIEPLAKRLHRHRVKKSIAAAISTLLFIVILLVIIVGAGAIFANQIYNIADKIPSYAVILQDQIEKNSVMLQERWDALPPDIAEKAREYTSNIVVYGSKFASWFLKALFSWLSSFSSFLVNFLIGIILAYFLSIEIDDWKRVAREGTPRTFKKAFLFIKENVLAGIVGYLKAQLKMVSVTFVVILIALLILGVKNAFTISLLAAVFDVLPLLGVSTVFIPWIVYLFIVGDTTLAICLSVLLGVVLLVRQILEPKITGDTLGVSAFTMLAMMIISLSLFGVAGLILSPIIIITLKALYEQGYLSSWIHLPEDEYDDGGPPL